MGLSLLGMIPVAGGVIKGVKAGVKKGKKNSKSVATVFDGVTTYSDALRKALAGKHLNRTDIGKYVGAPEQITSPQALAANREQALRKVKEGAFNADWYDRARAIDDEVSGGDGSMASLFSRGGAANSPQNTPMNEVNDFLRQHNSTVLTGETPMVRTGAQRVNVARAYTVDPTAARVEIDPAKIRLGKKTGPYADAKDPTIPPEDLYKTANDLWHGRVMGYGKDFNRAFTPQEHGFLTGENLILADRAQKSGAGAGFLPQGYQWTPRSAQASTWGAQRLESYATKHEKAVKDALRKGKKAPVTPSMEDWKRRASYGIDDAVERNTANDTYEFITGQNTGHLAGLNAMDDAARRGYDAKMGANYLRTNNGRMRDPIYDDLQMYQRDALPTEGSYLNSEGVLEHNPGWTSRPLVGVEGSRLGVNAKGNMKRGGPQITGSDKEAMRMAATLRGLVTGQEATGWTKFTDANTASQAAEINALRFTGSRAESKAATEALKAQGLDVVDLGDGAVAGKFDGSANKKVINSAFRASHLPVDRTAPGRWESGLEEIPWTKQEGTGATTRAVLDKLREPGSGGGIRGAEDRLDAGRFRGTMEGMNEIDAKIAAEKNLPVRQDLMRLRKMISEIGLEGVRAYVKKTGGVGLPALALVPSLSGLLEEPSSTDR
jgi:hypothetical protein